MGISGEALVGRRLELYREIQLEVITHTTFPETLHDAHGYGFPFVWVSECHSLNFGLVLLIHIKKTNKIFNWKNILAVNLLGFLQSLEEVLERKTPNFYMSAYFLDTYYSMNPFSLMK